MTLIRCKSQPLKDACKRCSVGGKERNVGWGNIRHTVRLGVWIHAVTTKPASRSTNHNSAPDDFFSPVFNFFSLHLFSLSRFHILVSGWTQCDLLVYIYIYIKWLVCVCPETEPLWTGYRSARCQVIPRPLTVWSVFTEGLGGTGSEAALPNTGSLSFPSGI